MALFHGQAGFYKRKNFILKLMCEDQVVTSQGDKHNVIFDYFDGLLGFALCCAYTLDLKLFHREGVDLLALDVVMLEEEVWDTIKSFLADRAPGLDRHTGWFFKSHWQLIKAYFMASIMMLQQGDARKLRLLVQHISHSYSKEGRGSTSQGLQFDKPHS
jgi:hypothetical protein